jgi:hypothetical protein
MVKSILVLVIALMGTVTVHAQVNHERIEVGEFLQDHRSTGPTSGLELSPDILLKSKLKPIDLLPLSKGSSEPDTEYALDPQVLEKKKLVLAPSINEADTNPSNNKP